VCCCHLLLGRPVLLLLCKGPAQSGCADTSSTCRALTNWSSIVGELLCLNCCRPCNTAAASGQRWL
jgi:hypothetical protein